MKMDKYSNCKVECALGESMLLPKEEKKKAHTLN